MSIFSNNVQSGVVLHQCIVDLWLKQLVNQWRLLGHVKLSEKVKTSCLYLTSTRSKYGINPHTNQTTTPVQLKSTEKRRYV